MLSKLATQVHRENVSDLDISWLLFQSNSICVWCVHWKSENSLFCKHVICNMCVRIYENEMLIMNCQYHIKTCLLCHSENCIVRLKSFVADERILTIDEKDTHDVISLEIMTIIQSMIESKLQIQDFFDIAFDTSVDKLHVQISRIIRLKYETEYLIVCILFLRDMSVSQCVHVFDALTRKLFEWSQERMNFIKRLRLFLKSWYRNDHYDANVLEDCLKKYLRINDCMFDYQSRILVIKVDIIVATIDNVSLMIFINYNESDVRKEECDKIECCAQRQKTEQKIRIYARSFEESWEWIMHMRSVSVSSLQKLRNWFFSDRATSTASVWVHLCSCTTKHDWRETVCIDQHKSRHSNRFRMMKWANTTTLSELRCWNIYTTILIFWSRMSLCLLTQMLRRSQHLSELSTFVTWFSMTMYLDFDDLTCLSSMGKKFEMNSWTSWMRESEKTSFDWISSYSAMSWRLTTLIAWMSCKKAFTYHKCI